MQGDIIAAVLLFIPILLVLILRTNAALMFFVLAGSITLQNYLDKDVASFTSTLLNAKNSSLVALLLIVIPFLVAAFAFRHTVAKNALFLHLLLAVGVGGTLLIVLPSYISLGVAGAVAQGVVGTNILPFTSVILSATFLASVVVLWFSHPRSGHHKKHGR